MFWDGKFLAILLSCVCMMILRFFTDSLIGLIVLRRAAYRHDHDYTLFRRAQETNNVVLTANDQWFSLRQVVFANQNDKNMHDLGLADVFRHKILTTLIVDRIASASAGYNKYMISPRHDDTETILNFAKMSSNAYITRSIQDWHNLTDYVDVDDFGWDNSGLRGYIFTSADHSTVVVAFKGTSTLFSGGDTISKDKYMDNLMFSCCCARVDISWIPVCGCYTGRFIGGIPGQTCNITCLETTLREQPDSYYKQAVNITERIREKYPHATLWFTGHSMGGSIANLMAIKYHGTSSITFEAPGEALYAQRLGLVHSQIEPPDGKTEDTKRRRWWPWPRKPRPHDPYNPPSYPIWNYGVSTDPVYMGMCTGVTTSCYLSGYALETKCRHGADCTYILPGKLDVGSHRIDWVIDHVIKTQKIPFCVAQTNCSDCDAWDFSR